MHFECGNSSLVAVIIKVKNSSKYKIRIIETSQEAIKSAARILEQSNVINSSGSIPVQVRKLDQFFLGT